MTMNPEIKAKWVADLRSGKYPQGQRMLNSSNGYCCLGVLCEQAVVAGVVVRAPYQGITDEDDDFKAWSYGVPEEELSFEAHCLPREVAVWAGLANGFPGVLQPSHTVPTSLTALNDNDKLSFQKIAELIEGDEEI